MFDIGFTELLVIALVALLVLGPERLPKVARIVGHWTGRAQKFIEHTRQEINREIQAQESGELGKLQQDLIETQRLIQDSTSDLERSFQEQTQALESDLNPDAPSPEFKLPEPTAKPSHPPAEAAPKKAPARKPVGTSTKPVKRVKTTRRKNGVDS